MTEQYDPTRNADRWTTLWDERRSRRLGISFDWRTRLHTSDPEFYRWNQW